MIRTDPSIESLAALLPIAHAEDVEKRLEGLAEHLRNAPVSGPGSEIFDLAADAISALPASPATSSRAMCLLLITRQRFSSGRPFMGVEPALEAVAIAERVGEPLLLAKSLKLLGVIYEETGNYPDATNALAQALLAARTAGDALQETEILCNLGVAHQYASQFSTAVPCYERAAEIADAAGTSPIGRALPRSNLALASLHLRDFARGLDAAEQAIEILKDLPDQEVRRSRVMTEFYYTRLLLEVRNVARASERAKLARVHAVGAGALAELFAEMAQGLTEVYELATRDIGLSRLQRAVNLCRRGMPTALRDALITLVRAYEVAGQPNSALVLQHEVVQLNRDSKVKNLIQHHHMHIVRVQKVLDARADAAMDLQQQELRFRRFSMDELAEFTSLLEENSVAAELHDDDTGEHCYRVGALAKELAKRKGMDEEMCRLIDLSARLHDVGKLRVPDSILLKPGRFTPEERAIMERHCEFGWEIIGQGGLGQLFVAQEIALNHHERWDGTGYPHRVRGEMIPMSARITALSDVYDALTHKRSYKDAWSIEDALREIGSLRGKHFDPELTDIFLDLVPKLLAAHGNLDTYLGADAKKSHFIANRERVARELKTDLGTFDVRR